MKETQEPVGGIDNSISAMQLNIGRLEVNCFDEDAEMSIRVGKSSYQSLSVDEAKELASFIVSHIKNETEANPELDAEQAATNWQKENEKYMPDEQSESMLYDSFIAGVEWKSKQGQPVGIDVEVLAADYLKKVGTHDRPDITKHDFMEGFKAGYAASLPQSSTEEEKDDDEGWIYCPNCGRVKAEQ